MASVTTRTGVEAPATQAPPRRRPRVGRTARAFYWMVVPAFLLFFIFHTIPVLQGVFLLLAVSVVIANFLADLVYGVLDPRVKA